MYMTSGSPRGETPIARVSTRSPFGSGKPRTWEDRTRGPRVAGRRLLSRGSRRSGSEEAPGAAASPRALARAGGPRRGGPVADVKHILPTCCLTSRSYHMRRRPSYPGPPLNTAIPPTRIVSQGGRTTEVWQTAVGTLRREAPRPRLEALGDAFYATHEAPVSE
jgi:hypothetical protein